MGTRNLTMVYIDGKYKVAQYCQWDGYPSGQGVGVLSFLHSMDEKRFIEKCRAVKKITQKALKNLWIECGADPNSDMVSLDVCENFNAKYPHLHRDCGSKILQIIQESAKGLKLNSDIYFVADSLFCEWAYVIDFDKGTFEVYKGFNTKPLTETERFYSFSKCCRKEKNPHSGNVYYPIKRFMSYKLNKLPTKTTFLDTCTKKLKG